MASASSRMVSSVLGAEFTNNAMFAVILLST